MRHCICNVFGNIVAVWFLYVALQVLLIVENFQQREREKGAFYVGEKKLSIVLVNSWWIGEELFRRRVVEMDWAIVRGRDIDDRTNGSRTARASSSDMARISDMVRTLRPVSAAMTVPTTAR